MTSHHSLMGDDSSTVAPSLVQRSSRIGQWTRRLGCLAVLVVMVIAGVWSLWQASPTLPEIPVVNIDGFDPEIADAIERARLAVEKDPRSKKAWGQLAMVLHAHGFEDQAVICYAATGLLDPKNYLWPYLQGVVLWKAPAGPAKAVRCFEHAVRIVPSEPLPRLWLAEMLLELDRQDEAAKEFDTVLSADPNNERAQFGLGKLAIARQQYPRALSFLESIANNPSARRSSCALRAVAHERLGHRESAERERRQLANLPPDDSWPDNAATQIADRRVGLVARLHRVRQMGIDGRTFDAIALLQDTADLYPKSEETWFSLGKLLFVSNDPINSRRALKRCLELSPNNAEYLFMLGAVEFGMQEHADAADLFRRAIELKPRDERPHYGLGECLQALGDSEGAAAAYRKTLEIQPNHTLAQERLAKLNEKP